jgi:hypothetical protein
VGGAESFFPFLGGENRLGRWLTAARPARSGVDGPARASVWGGQRGCLVMLRIEIEFVCYSGEGVLGISRSPSMNAPQIISFAASADSGCAHQRSTCCRIGSKFRCIRSTPTESASSSEKRFECFANT